MKLDDSYFLIYTVNDIDYSFCRECICEKGTIKKTCGHPLCDNCYQKKENCPILCCEGK